MNQPVEPLSAEEALYDAIYPLRDGNPKHFAGMLHGDGSCAPSCHAADYAKVRAYLDAARVAAPSDGLRELMDSLGPVTFGPGCAPFDHPLGCQCPYPVAAAERDRLAARATTGQPEGER